MCVSVLHSVCCMNACVYMHAYDRLQSRPGLLHVQVSMQFAHALVICGTATCVLLQGTAIYPLRPGATSTVRMAMIIRGGGGGGGTALTEEFFNLSLNQDYISTLRTCSIQYDAEYTLADNGWRCYKTAS